MMSDFELDSRLEADSLPITRLGLCQLRLRDDARWPWLILVPQRNSIVEFFDLTPLDQTMLTFESALTGQALKKATGCHKINCGALGNVVRQYHLHLVARNEGDENWPGPVWGFGARKTWEKKAKADFVGRLMDALTE